MASSDAKFGTSVTLDISLMEFVNKEKDSGNFSGLVNKLLKDYLNGGGSDDTSNIRYEILKKQTEKLKEEVEAQWAAIHAAISDHGSASEKRTSEKQKIEDQILSRLEKEFSDIPIRDGALQYRAWARSLKLDGSDPQGIIKNRIASIATLTGASRADVMAIVGRDYPGIIDLLNLDPGVL